MMCASAGASRSRRAGPYPLGSYFPRNTRPPSWAESFVAVVAGVEGSISTVDKTAGIDGDDVLKEKTKTAKIFRPVLFGDNGVPEVRYEIDAFHDGLGIAVEVKARRGAAGNADYRDLVRTSLILDAAYLALLMPVKYRTTSGARVQTIPAFARTRGQLSAIYASQPLRLLFERVLLVGY